MRALFPVMMCMGMFACGGSETDAPADTDGDTATEVEGHPLVPDEFKLLWNTDGDCSTEFGDGDQMYMIFEGRVEADGTLTGTERVWWFFADKPDGDDCVDTFSLNGTTIPGEPGALGCSSCEEFYDTRRTVTENNCKARYDQVYRSDDDGIYQTLMFDTLNEFNDTPNENNKLGVFHEEKKWRGEDYVTKLYAAQTGSVIEPDSDSNFGPPATYKWIGKRCQVSYGGGGN